MNAANLLPIELHEDIALFREALRYTAADTSAAARFATEAGIAVSGFESIRSGSRLRCRAFCRASPVVGRSTTATGKIHSKIEGRGGWQGIRDRSLQYHIDFATSNSSSRR
jgi:hypothetical protein